MKKPQGNVELRTSPRSDSARAGWLAQQVAPRVARRNTSRQHGPHLEAGILTTVSKDTWFVCLRPAIGSNENPVIFVLKPQIFLAGRCPAPHQG